MQVFLTVLLAAVIVSFASRASAQQKKDYLSDAEADKIRDAAFTGPRIMLYTGFALDRIKKLQYEFGHLDPADDRRAERINALLNGYSGCVDDAADLVDLGVEKQQDIRQGLKELQSHIKDFLTYLQSLSSSGPELDTYKDNLDDAIEATQDAQQSLDRAVKENAPPPVRRKPQ
jgi:hypothetical protein